MEEKMTADSGQTYVSPDTSVTELRPVVLLEMQSILYLSIFVDKLWTIKSISYFSTTMQDKQNVYKIYRCTSRFRLQECAHHVYLFVHLTSGHMPQSH